MGHSSVSRYGTTPHALHCGLSSCGPLLQTGAGKTYTMSGEAQQYARRGIVPRALHQLFQEVELRVDRSYEVKVSFLEIYNEVGQPLLLLCLGLFPLNNSCIDFEGHKTHLSCFKGSRRLSGDFQKVR